MSSDLMQVNQEYEFEARNPRPGYKRLKAGDIFTWNLEVEESVWTMLKDLPDNAIIDVRFYFHDGDSAEPDSSSDPIDLRIKPPRKKDLPKGEWGKYWEVLCGTNFIFNNPDLQSVLPMDMGGFDESVWTGYKDCLKAVFEVESLTFISPADFERWLEDNQLFNIITISRQAAQISGIG